MRRSGSMVCATLALLLLTPVLAEESGEPVPPYIGPNIKITLTVGDVDAGKTSEKIYKLLARDGASKARMLMGWRTPIPTTSGVGDDGSAPVTSYTYQNVGMTAVLEAKLVADGRVLVSGVVELSGARGQGPEGMQAPQNAPIIGTFQQDLNVLLQPGQALRVAEVPDLDQGTLYLELSAEVLGSK